MKNTINEIISAYTMGKKSLEETNQALEDIHAGLVLDPGRNELTEEEKLETVVGYYPEQANGFGLLDTGTGTLDKVRVVDGELVNCDCGGMFALVYIAGRCYEVKGKTLVEA